MAERVVLHVGPPKTGTTYLQGILWANREELAARDVVVPWRRTSSHNQAAWSLMGVRHRDRRSGNPEHTWDRFVERADAADGVVVLSTEAFAAAQPTDLATAMASLSPAEVHVVMTGRDFTRQVPSLWQQYVKHRGTQSLADYVTSLRTGANREWGAQYLPDLVARWREVLPAGQVHLVTLPPRGAAPELLWHRFAEAVGLPGGGLDLTPVNDNSSLSAVQVEALRQLNHQLGDRLPMWEGYVPTVRHGVVPTLRTAGADESAPIRLSAEDHAWAAGVADDTVRALSAIDLTLHGDLDDLGPIAPADPGNPVTDEAVRRAVIDTVVGLAESRTALLEENRRLRQASAEATNPAASATTRPGLRRRLRAARGAR